ncbi:hypothetical protein FJR04_19080 [Anabaena sp. UHCC 0204]|nr:hypothetical protein [Anabaena sp. UHCC 0204]
MQLLSFPWQHIIFTKCFNLQLQNLGSRGKGAEGQGSRGAEEQRSRGAEEQGGRGAGGQGSRGAEEQGGRGAGGQRSRGSRGSRGEKYLQRTTDNEQRTTDKKTFSAIPI